MRHAKWVLFIAALTLAACAPSGRDGATTDVIPQEPGMTEPAGQEDMAAELAGTQWMLVTIDHAGQEIPAVAGSLATLEFQPSGEAVGEGGCNSFGGIYQVTGNTLTISDITSTLIACEDQVVMDQETQYLDALESANSFELSGDTLIIIYNGGSDMLIFEAV